MDIFLNLEKTIGLPSDQIRMVTGFLLTIPFGFFFKMLDGLKVFLIVQVNL
jgi:hypothetical protein